MKPQHYAASMYNDFRAEVNLLEIHFNFVDFQKFQSNLQLRDVKMRYGADLEFMRQEFDRLERELAPSNL